MSGEENKALVLRYIQAIDDNDSSDWSVIDEFVAEDFVAHNPPLPGVSLDRDGLKQAAEVFRRATPGKHEVPMQVAEDDLVVSRIIGRGVHAGELMGSRRRTSRSRRTASRSTAFATAGSSSTGRSSMSHTSCSR
jgi:SnoaL-like polyketide cyclase